MSNYVMQAPIQKRGDLNSFQRDVIHSFDTVLYSKRRLRRKNTPEYRRINRYFKSTSQYWKERNRRKQVYVLAQQGLTLKQIAEKIGCSYRTVRRDAVKLEPYVKAELERHFTRLHREQRERLSAELEASTNSDLLSRYKRITRLMCLSMKARKLSQAEIEKQHNNMLFLDYDNLDGNGYPTVKIAYPGRAFKTPYNLSVIAVKDGKPQRVLGGIKIG
jgi:transposase